MDQLIGGNMQRPIFHRERSLCVQSRLRAHECDECVHADLLIRCCLGGNPHTEHNQPCNDYPGWSNSVYLWAWHWVININLFDKSLHYKTWVLLSLTAPNRLWSKKWHPFV